MTNRSRATSVQYSWNNGSPDTSQVIDSSGIYWVDISKKQCIKRDSIVVSFLEIPHVSLGNDTILCNNQSLMLNATNPNATYIWQNGSTDSFFKVTTSGIYKVNVGLLNTCYHSDSILIDYLYTPTIFLPTDTSICNDQKPLILNAAYPNSNYQWQDGSTNFFYAVNSEGNYTVTVSNKCGTKTFFTHVSFKDCNLFIPNVFTPNNDQNNDYFVVRNIEYHEAELKILDRWGAEVFSSKHYQNEWNGANLPDGIYFYHLTTYNTKSDYKGWIQLIR